MRANRIDQNQPEIVKQFRDFGCSVLGRSIFVELKDGKKPPSARKLTPGETKFKSVTLGIWRLVETEKDAQNVINELNSTLAIPMRWDKK